MLTPEKKSTLEYKVSPEEMWNTIRGESQNWGIEGYEVPKQYFDYQQVKWIQKREEILKAKKREWPPSDWPKDKETDKPKPPVRVNFIDDVIKIAKSFNDPVKSEEIKANLESRGTFKVPEPKAPINMREKFLKEEKERKEKRDALPKIQEWKVNGIEDAKRRKEEMDAARRPLIDIYKEKYSKEKPAWPRCDRVTIMSDCEYAGERIPFYNTHKKDGEEIDKNNLFFPRKEKLMRKAPVWSFANKNSVNLPTEQMQNRDNAMNEKIENLKNSKNLTDKDLLIDIEKSRKLIEKRGRYPITIHKSYDYASTEQYKLCKEQRPEYSPGPQHYWKIKNRGDFDVNAVPKELMEEKEEDGKTKKVYYMNRRRTDFRIFKPMRSSVF